MSITTRIFLIALAAGSLAPLSAAAQAPHIVYDQQRGEMSPGTQMPTQDQLMNVIRSGSPSALESMLDYAERLECYKCVPLIEQRILQSNNAKVREFAAWWLRRRLFALSSAFDYMKGILQNDPDPVRRRRAAGALGEFLVPASLTPLSQAAMTDGDPTVRAAAVKALGRLNDPDGNTVIAAAMADPDVSVRRAAMSDVPRVNFFQQFDALINALADSDADVRTQSAKLLGHFKVSEAVPALTALLQTDSNRDVRQAAAWALGRIGGTDAVQALLDAQSSETDSLVRDAIRIALAM